jgi:lipid II:glycine glycyltransferase (peptidoglycan interpeptide bridge formation enzyme)
MIAHREINDRVLWNGAIRQLPGMSILQTWEWGQVKQAYGWKPHYLLWSDESNRPAAAALLLVKPLAVPGLKTAYAPQGPLLDWTDAELYHQVMEELEAKARGLEAFSLKIDPEVILAYGEELAENEPQRAAAETVIAYLSGRSYVYSSQQIQFKNTAFLMVNAPDDTLLAAMKQKTRYNIRLAGRKGVTVRHGTAEDIDLLYRMYLETSVRDEFIIRPREYYERVWTTFINAEMATPLIAEVDNEPVAGLMLFSFGTRAWYLYGMSTNKHREKMPNYLLQWEAMQLSREMGCTVYDLWGAPDIFDESDSMWGVYRFKQGLGAEAVQRIGAFDLPLKKNTYKIFIEIIPRLQTILRRVRRGQQNQELN